MPTPTLLQLKVSLLDVRHPVWRRLLLPADTTLLGVHRVLQDAMGWFDGHLHEFQAGEDGIERFGPIEPGDPDAREPTLRDERRVRLAALLPRIGASLLYVYDFGDNWRHKIVLEKRRPAVPGVSYPVCTAGRRACPPEDCGGPRGYARLQHILRHPDHPEFEDLRAWAGDDFDPDAFSLTDINRRLTPAPRGGAAGPLTH